MKKAAKSVKLNILGAALAILGVGIPLGIYGITCIPSLNASPFPYIYLMFVFAFLYLLIGFVVSDIQIARWRRKNAKYDEELPQEVKDKAWSIRYPLYLAFLLVFLTCMSFEICYWITKDYPLPISI